MIQMTTDDLKQRLKSKLSVFDFQKEFDLLHIQ